MVRGRCQCCQLDQDQNEEHFESGSFKWTFDDGNK